MRVLGVVVQMDGRHDSELRQLIPQTLIIFHAKRPLWLVKERLHQKLQALHLSVFPAVGWSAGILHWTSNEVRQVPSMQTLPFAGAHA